MASCTAYGRPGPRTMTCGSILLALERLTQKAEA